MGTEVDAVVVEFVVAERRKMSCNIHWYMLYVRGNVEERSNLFAYPMTHLSQGNVLVYIGTGVIAVEIVAMKVNILVALTEGVLVVENCGQSSARTVRMDEVQVLEQEVEQWVQIEKIDAAEMAGMVGLAGKAGKAEIVEIAELFVMAAIRSGDQVILIVVIVLRILAVWLSLWIRQVVHFVRAAKVEKVGRAERTE